MDGIPSDDNFLNNQLEMTNEWFGQLLEIEEEIDNGKQNNMQESVIEFFHTSMPDEEYPYKNFGICDDEDESAKTPAYVSIDPTDKWVAIVQNRTEKPINFTAVDNCIEIRRANGDMDNRCDAILTNDEHIVFIELKVQRTSGWITHAVDEQLQTTIDHFKENCDIDKYRYKRAFVCNRKISTFQMPVIKAKNECFLLKRNHIRLSIEQTIVFK